MGERREKKLSALLDVAIAMTATRDLDTLLELILKVSKEVVDADRCSIFVFDAATDELWSRYAHGLEHGEIRLAAGQGLVGWVASEDKVLNIEDAYRDERFDRAVDKATGYRTRSILAAPMRCPRGEVVGVIQALNHEGNQPFTKEDEELLMALGGQAGAALQNALLNESIEALFEGFVKASVVAIESRDPSTSGHSERVAKMTVALAEAVGTCHTGPFAEVRVAEAELRELRYASLLHDFGKVGVREQVLVKAKKLYPMELELMEVRFALARANFERDYYRQLSNLSDGLQRRELERRLEEQLTLLDEYWRYVESCNQPTVLDGSGNERIREIANLQIPGLRGPEPLLREQEVEMLSITRGTLTAGERREIEEHVCHTFRFLSMIPWTKDLARVPELAYSHHEKLNGGGYPRHLTADQIPFGSRMMTIADIYDALTATDRPYKPAVPKTKAIDILQHEARLGLIDADLLELFVTLDIPIVAGD